MRLCFVVPVHGRHQLAGACLRQLARTCAALADAGLDASAVLVGDEPLFARLADELGFGWLPAANMPLGRKWNDGFEFACRFAEASHLVPLGCDDIVDHRLFLKLPAPGTILCRRRSAIVSPDGERIAELLIPYEGGDGVRVIPRDVLERVKFRPAGEERDRAIDGSMSERLGSVRYEYQDLHALQIVDLKSADEGQRNSYESCLQYKVAEHGDVWGRLGGFYPAAFLDEVRAAYPAVVAA